MKLLLDTDIGSDIDDAVCLAYLLMQPECDLLGITTVSGQSKARAKLASAICTAASRDIQIVPGSEDPLIVKPRQPLAQQAVKLANWPHAVQFPERNPIAFLAESIMKHPGEVILLSIGPLTNIALLFKTYPEVVSALKQLVMMCGAFTYSIKPPFLAEWNALLDPHATAIVYRADVAVHKSVGLDVTRCLQMRVDQVRENFIHPVLEPVLDFAEVWFLEQELLTFHDPLAAVTLFEPDVCNFTSGLVEVNLDDSTQPLGLTYFNEDTDHPRHQVAMEVDIDQFFTAFFRVFQR